jgi:hypothetical protein
MSKSDFGMGVRCVKRPEGVRAAPGVIGYYANGIKKGQLTIDGDDGDDIDIVYTAYYKWGSLVALNQNTAPFNSADVLAIPTEYAGPAITNYAEVPYDINGVTMADSWTPDYVNGLGDPCVYYFGDEGWRLPTQVENNLFAAALTVPDVGTPSPANPLWLTTKDGQKLLSAAGKRDSATGNITALGTGAWYRATIDNLPSPFSRMIVFGDVGYELSSLGYEYTAWDDWELATPIRCTR